MATLLFVCVLVFPPLGMGLQVAGEVLPYRNSRPRAAGEVCECVQRLLYYWMCGYDSTIDASLDPNVQGDPTRDRGERRGWSADGERIRVA